MVCRSKFGHVSRSKKHIKLIIVRNHFPVRYKTPLSRQGNADVFYRRKTNFFFTFSTKISFEKRVFGIFVDNFWNGFIDGREVSWQRRGIKTAILTGAKWNNNFQQFRYIEFLQIFSKFSSEFLPDFSNIFSKFRQNFLKIFFKYSLLFPQILFKI